MSEKDNKRIEILEDFPVSDLRLGVFGNPRKIKKKKADELYDSMVRLGDFGVILIDESNNVIAGNQRVALLKEKQPDAVVLVKRLIGYTDTELKAINIKDNTHAGEWDLDVLAEWTSDLEIDLGIPSKGKEITDVGNKQMELIHYEKYDYVMLVCRNEIDYDILIDKLGIKGAKVKVANKRSIKGRAVWYDEVKDKLFHA